MRSRVLIAALIAASTSASTLAQNETAPKQPAQPATPGRPATPAQPATPATPAKPETPGQPAMPEMSPEKMKEMQAWMEAGTPNENHRRLDVFVGEWNAKVWAQHDPSMPAEESDARMVNRFVMDGRYLQQNFQGAFMGQPFRGQAMVGYDNIEKRYFSMWVDSMSTAPMVSHGQWDEASKTFTFTSSMKDPMGKMCQGKEVLRILGADKHVMTMFQIEGSTERKVMEITYTKVADEDTRGNRPPGERGRGGENRPGRPDSSRPAPGGANNPR